MSIPDIVKAIITLSEDKELCTQMGEIGKKRVLSKYKIQDMKNTYQKIDSELVNDDVAISDVNCKSASNENNAADAASEMQMSFDMLKDRLLK